MDFNLYELNELEKSEFMFYAIENLHVNIISKLIQKNIFDMNVKYHDKYYVQAVYIYNDKYPDIIREIVKSDRFVLTRDILEYIYILNDELKDALVDKCKSDDLKEAVMRKYGLKIQSKIN